MYQNFKKIIRRILAEVWRVLLVSSDPETESIEIVLKSMSEKNINLKNTNDDLFKKWVIRMGIKQLARGRKAGFRVLTFKWWLFGVVCLRYCPLETLTIGSYRLSDATSWLIHSALLCAEAGAVAAYEQNSERSISAYKNKNETEVLFIIRYQLS